MNTPKTNAPQLDKGVPMKPPEVSRNREEVHPQVHEARAFETYDAADVHETADTPWTHAASLEAPPPRPGFSQRWVRVSLKGDDDPTNMARKFREGWRPRLASTVPPKYNPPKVTAGRFQGCIGVEGMLLCERPEKMSEKQRAAIRDKTDRVTQGIEAELQSQSHPNMQITQDRRSSVKRGIRIQDDE